MFKAKDARIVLLKNKINLGLAKSLNIGLKAARGTFIARIDADDYALPERIERQVLCFEKNKRMVICGTCAWELKKSKKKAFDVPLGLSKTLKCMLCWKNVFIHPSVMLNADVMRKNNISYNENFRTAQDYDLWCRLSEFGDVTNMPDRLCVYRVHDNQISSKSVTLQIADRNRIIVNNLKMLNIECGAERLDDFLTIMGYSNKKMRICLITKETFVLCSRLMTSFGICSRMSIQKIVWNAFWLIKHRVCGEHFRFFSR